MVGTWIMGNDYRVKSAYDGGYSAGYLRRIRALFPDKRHVLHVFSGKVDLTALPGDTADLNPALNPTFVDDAQTLLGMLLERYQTTMVRRKAVMRALRRLPRHSGSVSLAGWRRLTWRRDR